MFTRYLNLFIKYIFICFKKLARNKEQTFCQRQPPHFFWSYAEPRRTPSEAGPTRRPELRRSIGECRPWPPCPRRWSARRWRWCRSKGLLLPGKVWQKVSGGREHSWPRARPFRRVFELALCWIRCPGNKERNVDISSEHSNENVK